MGLTCSQFYNCYRDLLARPDSINNKESNLDANADLHTFTDASFARAFVDMRSAAGSLITYRSMPVAWTSKATGNRVYSTAPPEYAATAESVSLSRGMMELRNLLSGSAGNTNTDQGPIWLDSITALITARQAAVDLSDTRPKSRHYALRYSQ